MKKLLVILVLGVAGIGLFAQEPIQKVRKTSGNLNHRERVSVNLTIEEINALTGRTDSSLDTAYILVLNPYPDTIDMDDYYDATIDKDAYKFNSSSSVIDFGVDNEQARVVLTQDTMLLKYTTTPNFYFKRDAVYINTEDSITSSVAGFANDVYFQDYTNTNRTVTPVIFSSLFYPESGDTIIMDYLRSFYMQLQTYTPSASSMIQLDDARVLDIYAAMDNYVSVDSLTVLYLNARNSGIPDDSIGKLYIIKNFDNGLRGADATYFLYSEYGDIFSAGNYDQFGDVILLGSDQNTWTQRTDEYRKAGRILSPHYLNAEEPFTGLAMQSAPTQNKLFLGGGNNTYNTATDIYFYVSADGITLAGTEVAHIDSTGFEILSGAIKQVQLTGSLTDGAPTDGEIDTVTGTTPATVGAGWTVTILDNDGSGLLYRVESDGTNWVYWTGTQAS